MNHKSNFWKKNLAENSAEITENSSNIFFRTLKKISEETSKNMLFIQEVVPGGTSEEISCRNPIELKRRTFEWLSRGISEEILR